MRLLLLPFAWIYGTVVMIRNLFYDKGWIKQVSFPFPVIVIGNLSTGGTGKTPMTAFLADVFRKKYRVAILSRGYGRNTKGFRIVNKYDSADASGDEPLLYAQLFDDVTVAVCENRVTGIQNLSSHNPSPEIYLLDDAYQHRSVRPGLSVLLTDCKHLYSDDMLLPAGNLREPASGAGRADIIVITKCNKDISIQEQNTIMRKVQWKPSQPVYFSYIRYREPVYIKDNTEFSLADKSVFLFCGIARPDGLMQYIRINADKTEFKFYPDHYSYSEKDIRELADNFNKFAAENKNAVLLTTRKDLMRLTDNSIRDIINTLPLAVIDIELKFIDNSETEFTKHIDDYIRSDKNFG